MFEVKQSHTLHKRWPFTALVEMQWPSVWNGKLQEWVHPFQLPYLWLLTEAKNDSRANHLLPLHTDRGGAVALYADTSLATPSRMYTAGKWFYLHNAPPPPLCNTSQVKPCSTRVFTHHRLTAVDVYSPLPSFPSSGSFLKWIPCTSTCDSPPQFTAHITRSARLRPPPSAQHRSASSDSTAATRPATSCAVSRCIATHRRRS